MVDESLKIFRPVHVNGLKRMGNKYDGGYIVHVPSLSDADYLINYGVGYNVSFEKEFFQATGIPTLAFDPTLKEIAPIFEKLKKGEIVPFLRHVKNYLYWIFEESTLKASNINFIQEGIANSDNVQYKSLAYHFKKYNVADKKIIFKIDVEGAEYPVFNDPAVYSMLHNAIQIIAEFHDLRNQIEPVINIMNKLSETHSLIHIHSNNHAGTFKYNGKDVPEAIEVTFLLNKYLSEKKYTDEVYPVPGLDAPCDRKKPDIPLTFFY